MNKQLWYGLFLTVLLAGPATGAVTVPGPLVDTAWLAVSQKGVVILDVRKKTAGYYADPKNKSLGKIHGHIPGAMLVEYKRVRTKRKDGKYELKGMIPAKGDFEKLMRESGVDNESTVIITSEGLSSKDIAYATRLYWTLKYFGHDNVALLDGGTLKWILDKHPLSATIPPVKLGNFTARTERKALVAGAVDVVSTLRGGADQLVDTRPLDYYLGLVKKPYVDTKGHIPGAKVFPHSLLVGHVPATFYSTERLKGVMKSLDIDVARPTITYCNSGSLASATWFVMNELLGNNRVRLYDGSMNEWTKDPARPVEGVD